MTKISQVCESIVARIEAGELRDGDRLPSEEQLADGYAVSVGTMQKALARLAHAGLVSREHGRGTFITGTRLGPAGVSYLRFRDAQGHDLPHFVRVRRVRRETRGGPWAAFLGRDERTIRIERAISVAGHFELHAEFWLRERDFARIEGADARSLHGNLRELIGQRLALPTLRVEQLIRFERPPARVAATLALDEDAPAFVMEMRGHTLRDQPLFYQRVYSGPFSDSLVIDRAPT